MDDTRPLRGVPGVLAGRYRLLGSIGQGGMADVQRAYDEQLDREVAVKILHARYADDRSFLLRFRREAQAAASLNHPNIVSVYDAGDAEGRPFIVMELVRGRSLRDLTRVERLTAARAVEIVGDAALALDYAHEHGLIHRDIKPGNILVSHDGEVKVTDFGIARAVNAETITETAAVFGTAAYVSPEQAQGEVVDRRTDVYSLGCVLYELLTGQQPFHADSPVALAYQHVSAVPTPPSHLSDEATPELDAIVLKAMAKNPDDRYQTAREFNADLERARAGVPVTAPMGGGAAWATTQMVNDGDQTVVSSRAPGPYTQSYPTDDQMYGGDDYYEEEEPPRRTGLIILGVLLVLALLAAAFFLFQNLLGGQEETARLPDVRGMSEEDARATLGDLGFTNIRTEDVQDSEAEVGEVVGQDPAPDDGREFPLDTLITLQVNTGPPEVEVPDVTGMTRRDARNALEDVGLSLGDVSREPSDEVEEDLVISSDPEAGELVAEGTEVDLVISSGTPEAEVPDVIGLSRADAELELVRACEPQPCFQVEVRERFSDEAEGTVIDQSPSGGAEAEKGSTVELVVSRGPEEEPEPSPGDDDPGPGPGPEPGIVTVPDVIGEQLQDAAAELAAAGLIPSQNVDQEPNDAPPGTVIATDPGPGEEVEELTTVNITVSSGPETGGDGEGEG